MTVLEDTQALLAQLNARSAPRLSAMPAPQARVLFRGTMEICERPAPRLANIETFSVPGHGGEVVVRLYDPLGTGIAGPVLVFYHGGGWVLGDLESHNSLCAEIAHQLGIRVVAVDYRLAPEHPFPAAVEDCIAAARWVASSPSELGAAVTGLIPAGDSAGGNLAAVVSQALAQTSAVPFKAQFLIYPSTDLSGDYDSLSAFGQGYLLERSDMEYFSNAYVPDPAMRRDVRASPLLAEDLTGQPPALIFTCGLDPLRDQGRAYAARLIQTGVQVVYMEVPGQIHGCFNLRKVIPSAQAQLTRCLDALRQMIG